MKPCVGIMLYRSEEYQRKNIEKSPEKLQDLMGRIDLQRRQEKSIQGGLKEC